MTVHAMYMDKAKPHPKPTYRRNFIRPWRKFRGLTLYTLAERVGSTHATLSRIERGKSPYGQELLEAIAEALQTDPASLLIRDPTDEDAIWSLWDIAEPGERKTIVRVVRPLIKAAN